MQRIDVCEYDGVGPDVIVLHGGPAAPGQARPIAKGLAGKFRVFEPLQRGSGETELNVARHVADLHEAIGHYSRSTSPALVGHSWGAMLALAYAAEHPDTAGPVVLVGCGTFSEADRGKLQATLAERTTVQMRLELDRIAADVADPLERMRQQYAVMKSLYDVAAVADDGPDALEAFDADAHRETWDDMLRCQREGIYPQAFAAVRSPVLMIHGEDDPHPGTATRDTLREYMPQLEYVQLARCGHSPWKERYAREAFFECLCAWLRHHMA
jgi:pimeloyl-ACP methyl ester carboxylesterase